MIGVFYKATILVVLSSVPVSASNLTFKFVNPAFAGGPGAGEYMLEVARGIKKNHNSPTASRTPTYNFIVNDGSLTIQNGNGNFATTQIQNGNNNTSTTTQTAN